MRNLKKVLALVVAFSMMLSVVAFAGYKDVPADAEYAGALDLLSSLDIIKGDDLGNFNPDATITRAEMAAIVCRAKGLESAANGAKGATVFTDVAADHWASGYINLASQNNIINGYGNGKFGPEDTVTYEQVIKMLVCALGFEPMAAANGGWATGYLVVANRYKVTEGAAADATRKNVATLVYNALSTPMMDQTSFGADAEYQILDGKGGRDYKTLLTDMDIYVATGVVTNNYTIDTLEIDLTETSEDGEFVYDDEDDADNTAVFEKGSLNVAPYVYQSVDVYAKKTSRKDYEVVAIVGSVLGETLTILSDDVVFEDGVALDDGQFEYYVDAANSNKTKKVKFAGSIVLNNKDYKSGFDALAAMEDVEITLIENTSDRTFDMIVATQYTSAVVGYVDADRDKIEIDGTVVTFDFEDEDKEIVLVDDNGKELTLADFAEDDVVAFVSDNAKLSKATKVKIIKLSNAVVTGIVDETFTSNGDDYVVIDGNEYKVGDVDDELTVGSEGTFYVGITGKIVYFDGSVVGEDYAYILEAAPSKSSFSADKWQVKILTKDDGIVTYDVTDDMDTAFDKYFTDNAAAFDGDKVDGILFEDATIAEKAAAARLITFKTNAKGQIRAFAKAAGKGGKTLAPGLAEDGETPIAVEEYNDKTQIIDGKALEDEVVIFNVVGDEAEDAYATDLSYLVDESKYAGYVFANKNGENVAMIVTLGDSIFTKEAGLAIVTKVSDTKNAEDDDIVKVSYVQDGVEGTITFDSESTAKGGKDIDDAFFGIGSILVFNANAEGLVSDYAIIATVGYVDDKDNDDPEDDEIVEDVLVPNTAAYSLIMDDEDDAIIIGEIMNSKREYNKKGDLLTIKGETDPVLVTTSANMYTYDNGGRKLAIRVGDYMENDKMDFYDEEVGATSIVFIRVVEGDVVDIYGFAK